MHKIDIESSLRKINNKFVQNLSLQEKQKAVQSFKIMYAEQMKRESGGLYRKKKIQENLQELEKQNYVQKQTIQQELKKKLVSTEKNRVKSMQNKMKEHKLLEENWKRRWEQMAKKRRFSEMQSFEKAQKIRKQTQQYFVKKQSFFKTSQTNKSKNSLDHSQISHKKHPKSLFNKDKISQSIDHSLYRVDLPAIQKSKQEFKIFDLTDNSAEESPSKRRPQIKFNYQKLQQAKKEKQSEIFEKMISKLQKIEKNRHNVQQRREKIATLAKQARQQRQDPEKIAKNRQKSLQDLNFRRRVRDVTQRSRSKQLEKVKSNLDASIYQHLEAKKYKQQLQFQHRGQEYQLKFQKLKKNKMQKFVKDAVLTLKYQTLNQRGK